MTIHEGHGHRWVEGLCNDNGCEEFGRALVREEWRDHIPSGYEDQIGYGQVSCSCGWDSSDEKLAWEDHIDAAERIGRA